MPTTPGSAARTHLDPLFDRRGPPERWEDELRLDLGVLADRLGGRDEPGVGGPLLAGRALRAWWEARRDPQHALWRDR